MPAKKEKVSQSVEEVALSGFDYVNKKEQIKLIEKEIAKIRPSLESYLSVEGKTLEGGSILAVIPYADKEVHLRNTLRESNVLLPEAIDVLKKSGLKECIEKVEVVRDDIIARKYDAGEISDDVMKQLYKVKGSYAFSVTVKNRFDEAGA